MNLNLEIDKQMAEEWITNPPDPWEDPIYSKVVELDNIEAAKRQLDELLIKYKAQFLS